MQTQITAIGKAASNAGGFKALAIALKVSPQTVHQWKQGLRPIPVPRCVQIETKFGVSRRELRSDWAEVWPELAIC